MPQAGRTAAALYCLMVGEHATCRLHGWVALATNDEGAMLAAVWAEHGEALIGDARAYGFEPYWVTRTRPTGAGVEQWRARFLAAHAY